MTNEHNYLLLAEAVIEVARLDYVNGYKLAKNGKFDDIRLKGEAMMKESEDFLRSSWVSAVIDFDVEEVLALWRKL